MNFPDDGCSFQFTPPYSLAHLVYLVYLVYLVTEPDKQERPEKPEKLSGNKRVDNPKDLIGRSVPQLTRKIRASGNARPASLAKRAMND
jgi:hypothetical protein